MTRLTFTGLKTRPGQVWGGIRLVPLVRPEPIESLRLHPAARDSIVYEKMRGCWYAPHGLIAEWTGDGTAVPAYGSALQMAATTVRRSRKPPTKLGRRTRVRFVPHRVALESYLPLTFMSPAIAWPAWRPEAFRRGLPNVETPRRTSEDVTGLREALRVFEIYPGQCGVLVYTADALAGALVTPHPDDYRALHATLIEDHYSELIYRYALTHRAVGEFAARVDESTVATVEDLRERVATVEAEWAAFHDETMAAGLIGAASRFHEQYRMGEYALHGFRPADLMRPEGHVGEAITHEDGTLAYLRSYRLSETQLRRARLLDALAEHQWHLEATAASLRLEPGALAARIHQAGFGELLQQHIVDHYRAVQAY